MLTNLRNTVRPWRSSTDKERKLLEFAAHVVGADETGNGETNGKLTCARDLVMSLPGTNNEYLAGIVIGVGKLSTKRHTVG